MHQIFDYKKARRAVMCFRYYDNNSPYFEEGGLEDFTPLTNTFGKFAYTDFTLGEGSPLQYKIAGYDGVIKIHPGSALFISKSSKLSRDRVRNSGFRITYDIGKAGYIVVPYDRDTVDEPLKYSANIIVEHDGNLYLIDLYDAPSRLEKDKDIQDKVKELIDKYFGKGAYDNSYHKSNFDDFFVLFFPKVEEYKDIINGKYNDKSKVVVADTAIPLYTNADITADNLMSWEKMDRDAMAIAMVNSNYKEYPFTVGVFLFAKSKETYLPWGSQFEIMMKEVKFDRYNDYAPSFPITKKDWNLCQEYIMRHFNVSNSGGYINASDGDAVQNTLLKFVPHKIAIRPYIMETGEALINDMLQLVSK